MMDMTGAPCKTIRFDDSTVVPRIESGQLWRDLMFYDKENYIMSASTPGELLAAAWYDIIAIIEKVNAFAHSLRAHLMPMFYR